MDAADRVDSVEQSGHQSYLTREIDNVEIKINIDEII